MEPKPTVGCIHFRHPTDEQLQHNYIFSNYYNLQSVRFELIRVMDEHKTSYCANILFHNASMNTNSRKHFDPCVFLL